MTNSASRRFLPAVLALAVFLAWLGVAITHQHSAGPTCQFCKLVHNTPGDFARLTTTPEPSRTVVRIMSVSREPFAHNAVTIPQGRAPPAA